MGIPFANAWPTGVSWGGGYTFGRRERWFYSPSRVSSAGSPRSSRPSSVVNRIRRRHGQGWEGVCCQSRLKHLPSHEALKYGRSGVWSGMSHSTVVVLWPSWSGRCVLRRLSLVTVGRAKALGMTAMSESKRTAERQSCDRVSRVYRGARRR